MRLAMSLIVLLLFVIVACDKPAPAPKKPPPTKAAIVKPPTPPPAAPAEEKIAVEEDFEAEVAAQITEANYAEELEKLDKEIAAPESDSD